MNEFELSRNDDDDVDGLLGTAINLWIENSFLGGLLTHLAPYRALLYGSVSRPLKII